MKDFNEIKKTCEQISLISETLIDDFLLHYAAAKDKLAYEFDLCIAPYRHITKAETAWVNMMKSQYIIHRIFRDGGLLRKYLNHAQIKSRSEKEQQFLRDCLKVPWRFCFSRIISTPAPDFYEMEDVFAGTRFLLYSKGTTKILKEQEAMLWFNLIAYSGDCWQTFGPMHAYMSFDMDDIFFFATELNPRIDSAASLLQDVERKPVPYMLLLSGAQFPLTVNGKDELLLISAEHEQELIDVETLKDHFTVEYNAGVFRITIKKWSEPPHFAAAYFDEKEKNIMVTAMTERGFSALIHTMNTNGFDVSAEPQISVHPSMLVTTESILKRKLVLNPYEQRFFPAPDLQKDAEIDKINQFLESAIPVINAGKGLNIEALAKEAGIDGAFAKSLVEDMVSKIKGTKKKGK